MALSINTSAVRVAANKRVEGEDAEQFAEFSGISRPNQGAGVRALGSRLTSKQIEVIGSVLTDDQIEQLRGNEELLLGLRVYAETGDASKLTKEQNDILASVVKACKERVDNDQSVKNADSAKRRFWPRKVAAVVENYDAVEPEPETTSDDESGSLSPDTTIAEVADNPELIEQLEQSLAQAEATTDDAEGEANESDDDK